MEVVISSNSGKCTSADMSHFSMTKSHNPVRENTPKLTHLRQLNQIRL